ncbi:HvfB family MNIO-type RiPP peptide maturase [Pseudidiomarina salilacus]|uniref:HvfB family MNIO-type RiPP peptide maturase n=1 Tax=Pseudidiomarina salilacus TaxID=3384452 RepID=UPI0039847F37
MRRTVGLGLRREFLAEVLQQAPKVGFWELAPENWFPRGQAAYRQLDTLREQAPLTSHGLSLSIGSPDPLDIEFVQSVKRFLDRFNIDIYSEHLSYCSAQGQLYDLLPIPFTEEAVEHVVSRIKQVQDILERPLVLENVSYYASFANDLTELAFIQAVLAKADCSMLLDVNNVFVNSVNHGYDPYAFIQSLPSERIVYGHIAGHDEEYDDLFVDTHGADVKPEVWKLLDFAYQCHGVFPTVLERDFNIPPLPQLLNEATKIATTQQSVTQQEDADVI